MFSNQDGSQLRQPFCRQSRSKNLDCQYNVPKPDPYKRFIASECVGHTIKQEGTQAIYCTVKYGNSSHPSLNLTLIISTNSQAFVDIELSVNIHPPASTTQQTNRFLQLRNLLYSSTTPRQVKISIPFSQFVRR